MLSYLRLPLCGRQGTTRSSIKDKIKHKMSSNNETTPGGSHIIKNPPPGDQGVRARIPEAALHNSRRANAEAEKMAARVEEACDRNIQMRMTFRRYHTLAF